MPDMSHFFGSDLKVSATGSLATVDNLDLTTQRIIRRLMTAVNGYLWHVDYGAGIPQKIGTVTNILAIRSLVNSQIFNEASVAKTPPPKVDVTPFLNGVTCHITYTSVQTGSQTSLSFDVTK